MTVRTRPVQQGKPDVASEPQLHLCLPALGVTTRIILERVVDALVRDRPGQTFDALQIVLGEVLNNVVEHGYKDVPIGSVAVGVRSCGNSVLLEIRDWGHPYPTQDAAFGAVPDPAELAEGGYGWFLIRMLARGIRYRRDGCCNRLSLTVPI